MSSIPPRSQGRRRPASLLPLKLVEVEEALTQRLDNPAEVLDALIAALARGEQPLDAWRRLHEAAVEHVRLSDLARAYEQVVSEKRLKVLSAEQQAFVHLRAAEFFAGSVGNADIALDCAGRAVLAIPAQPQAFQILEWMREVAGPSTKLAAFYVDCAGRSADPAQRAEHLQRASEMVVVASDADELGLEVGQRILRLDPASQQVRSVVVQRLIARGRHSDVVELLERALERDPPPGWEEATLLREWLVDLCLSTLRDPMRALGHIEGLLELHPAHPMATQAAEALLENRAVSLRAAAALSNAYERSGAIDRAIAMLTFELKHARGPRRVEVQRRLGILRQDSLADPAGALELLAPVVAGDPGNDALRARFVALSISLNQLDPAARLLLRALQTSRDPAQRARIGVDVGQVYLRAGDAKRAQAAFQQVIESGQDEPSMLEAARRLSEMLAGSGPHKLLLGALELVVRLESEIEPRQAAARRLVELCDVEGGDRLRAIAAWRALIGSPWSDEALQRLETLYTETKDDAGLSEVMFQRAERAQEPAEGWRLSYAAAELAATATSDAEVAIAGWNRHLDSFGPSRAAHARIVPLLQRADRFGELADVLAREAELAESSERLELLLKLGELRLDLLGDGLAALEAFRAALELDPENAQARAALERLLVREDAGLAAADLLEPIFLGEGRGDALLRVLETRAQWSADPVLRLAALDEASDLAQGALQDPDRALELMGRAVAEAMANIPEALEVRLERLRDLAAASGNPARRAELLAAALGERPIDSMPTLALAKAAGEALAAAGDLPRAIEVYRRAIAFDAAPHDLVRRIDDLLAQQRAPGERVELYKAELEQQVDPVRRRELFHALATVQARELSDPAAATATWRRALEDDPKDLVAHHALVEVLLQASDIAAARTELERLLPELEGERRTRTLLRLAQLEVESGDGARALEHYRLLLSARDLDDVVLDRIEQLAREQADAETVRVVLERRLKYAIDANARAALLERLGNAYAWQLADEKSAAKAWLEGARAATGVSDDPERAQRLCKRVLDVDPDNREAAERLAEICVQAGDFAGAQAAFEVLLRVVPERELAPLVLALEGIALDRGQAQGFLALLELALARARAPEQQRKLELAKARVLAADPANMTVVCAIFQRVLGTADEDGAAIADQFEAFLARTPASSERIAASRWLFGWRLEHAADPAATLLTWAREEETSFEDPARALELLQKAAKRDPERSSVLRELGRLQMARGETAAALTTLEALRAKVEPDQRSALDLSMAELLVAIPGRCAEALELVQRILEATPGDTAALRIARLALVAPETRVQAAAILERVAEGSDDPLLRADLIEALLAVSGGVAEFSAARSRWLIELVETKSDTPEEALRLALRGAEAAPAEEELWSFAEQVARRLDRPAPVAEAYARALERELPPEIANVLGRRIVEFHEEWFEDSERVVALLERVLTLCPSATWAFDRLKLAFNSAARFPDLFALYDRRLAGTSDAAESIELLREAAMAARDFAADPERAISYFERLNRATPSDARVESSLERLYERHGHKRALIELLTVRLATLKPKESGELSGRIAALWLDLAEPVRAFELAVAMAERKTDLDVAVVLLERIVTLPSAASALLDEGDSVRERAARRLERHYRKKKSTLDVIRMLEIESETAKLPERIQLLEEVVSLRLGEPGDSAGAFTTLTALVELDPADSNRRVRFAEVAARVDAQDRRALTLIGVAEQNVVPALRAWLLAEAADVCRVELADRERATDLYRRVLLLDAEEPKAALHAARELSRMLRDDSQARELVSVLEALARLEESSEAKRSALGEAAELALGSLSDPDRAVRAWQARLALDPRDLVAVDGLCRALEMGQRWDDLVQALGVRAGLAEAASAALADRRRIAEIHALVKGDRAAAIEAWRDVQLHHGRSRESFDALEGLLAEEGRFAELAELLAEEVGREVDLERRRQLQRELGLVHQNRTHDVMAALNAFVRAEDWDKAIEVAGAEHAEAAFGCEVCERLLGLAVEAWVSSGESAESAAARAADWAVSALCARLLEAGKYTDVVSKLLSASELAFDELRRRELRLEAACLCSDRLGDPQRAIALFQALLAEEPADAVALSAVSRLAVLLEEYGEDAELTLLWERQARSRIKAEDTAGAAALWARAGDLAERRLKDVERALACYTEGASLRGEASLEALARIYVQRDEHAQASRVLEALCEQSSPEALAERAQRLADAYLACGDREKARACLESSAKIVVDATAIRARLAILYREARDFAALAALLGEDAERTSDKKAKLLLLREAAELHIEERSDPDAAVPLLERAIVLEPDEQKLRLRLAQALYRTRRYPEAVTVLRAQIERYGARRPKDRALAHFQLARVLIAAGHEGEALLELDAASKIDPANPAILQMLARVALEQNELDRAEKMYRSLLLVLGHDDDPEGPSKAEALTRLAEIAARRGDSVRAGEFIESAFEAALESPRDALALEAELHAQKRFDLLARALETRLGRKLPLPEAARALADLVMLHAEGLNDLERVRGSLEARARALQADLEASSEADEDAWSALSRVYDCLGDAAAEATVLERRVAGLARAGRSPADAELFYRLAKVRLRAPSTLEQGIDLLERALETRADFARARALLESVPELAETPRAAKIFERIARGSGDDQLLARALSLQLDGAEPSFARVREAVGAAQRAAAGALVETLLTRALDMNLADASDADLAWLHLELGELLLAKGERTRALEQRERAAAHLPAGEARALLLSVAEQYAAHEQYRSHAIRLYEKLLRDEPGDRALWQPLLLLLRSSGEGEQLARLLSQVVPLIDDVTERSALRIEQINVLLGQESQVGAVIELLQETIKDDSSQRDAARLLVELLEREGRLDELIALLALEIDLAKDAREIDVIVDLSLRLSEALRQRDRSSEAIGVCRAALEWDATRRSLLERLLRLGEAADDSIAVSDAIEGLLQIERGSVAAELSQRLSALRETQGDREGALRALELGFRASPDDAELRELLLVRFAERGEHDRVAELLNHALREHPEDRKLRERLIEAHRAALNLDAALGVLDELIAREPANVAFLRLRATLLTELLRDDEAVVALERAYASDPSIAPELIDAIERAVARAAPQDAAALTLRLVEVLETSGDLAGARARLATLVHDAPDNLRARRGLASLEARTGNVEGAILALAELIEVEHGEALVETALKLSEACELAGRIDESRFALERALGSDRKNFEVRRRLAAVYEASGAQRELSALLTEDAMNEPDPVQRFALSLRAAGLLLGPGGDPQAAVPLLESAREDNPENTDVVVLLARAYRAAGRTEEALALLNSIISASRGRRTKGVGAIYAAIAQIYLDEGFLTDALQALSKAFEYDPRNGELAMQLGQLAVEVDEAEMAQRAFRAVSIMKPRKDGETDGAPPDAKADANYFLAVLARKQGDPRKARVLATKALAENAEHPAAKALVAELDGRV